MKIKNITALFDEPGPQLTLKEHGPEPSLRQIVMMYYQQIGGVPVHRAKVLTEKYIISLAYDRLAYAQKTRNKETK